MSAQTETKKKRTYANTTSEERWQGLSVQELIRMDRRGSVNARHELLRRSRNTASEAELERITDQEMDDMHGHNSEGCYGQGEYL